MRRKRDFKNKYKDGGSIKRVTPVPDYTLGTDILPDYSDLELSGTDDYPTFTKDYSTLGAFGSIGAAMNKVNNPNVVAQAASDGIIGTEASVGSGSGFDATNFLQFAPDIMNFATGAFGKNETPPATKINQRAVDMVPEEFNVNPQLQQLRKNYRAIIADPNASPQAKLAAQSQMNQAASQVYGQKFNQEARMQANKAQLQAQLDRSQSRYDAQHRDDMQRTEANLGLTGNFARQALSDLSTKYLQKQAIEAKKQNDKQAFQAIIASYPKAVQQRLTKWFNS